MKNEKEELNKSTHRNSILITELEQSSAQKVSELDALKEEKDKLAKEVKELSQGKKKIEKESTDHRKSILMLQDQFSSLNDSEKKKSD